MQVKVIRSRRRTIAIEIDRELQVTVRAPFRMRQEDIFAFVESKTDWIHTHLEKMQCQRQRAGGQAAPPPLSVEELRILAEQARQVIPERVAYFARQMGVTYGRITIRNQKTRWGSCSSKGNLNFNCRLMKAPPAVLDYVVVHELCHRLEMNHSPRFWAKVEQVMPEYREHRKWLSVNGASLF